MGTLRGEWYRRKFDVLAQIEIGVLWPVLRALYMIVKPLILRGGGVRGFAQFLAQCPEGGWSLISFRLFSQPRAWLFPEAVGIERSHV